MKSTSIKNEYRDITDEELIELYRGGDDKIMDYLMNKYKNLVLNKSKSMFILGGENDDLIQEGMIGLFQAVRDYDFGRDASFYTFADLCISRKMYNAIKASNDKKHSFLNNYISIFANKSDEETGETFQIGEPTSTDEETNPEKVVLSKESVDKIEKAINEELTELERENFELYATGMSSGEIARILGKSPKETDNSIQRAKAKLRKILK